MEILLSLGVMSVAALVSGWIIRGSLLGLRDIKKLRANIEYERLRSKYR